MTQPDLHVVLIPGFFGFSAIGRMRYFDHVHRALNDAFEALGLTATLHDATPPPTGAMERRAAHLAELVAPLVADGQAPVHLIGHSTGGLDARMLLSPGVSLPGVDDLEDIARGVRSVVTVATPHHGAPLARTLGRAQGERLLAVLSLMTLHVVRLNRVAVGPLRALVSAMTTTGSVLDLSPGLLDSIWEDVLSDFDPARQAELRVFFREVRQDRSLVPQLTPEGIDALRDQLHARAGVRYGSVMTRARPPAAGLQRLAPPAGPNAQLYRVLHRLSAWDAAHPLPPLTGPLAEQAVSAWGDSPQRVTNDGIVPTRSMFWGQPVHMAWADHLDCLGFFTGPQHEPPHVDWIRTGTGFNRDAFQAMWTDVAGFIAADDGRWDAQAADIKER